MRWRDFQTDPPELKNVANDDAEHHSLFSDLIMVEVSGALHFATLWEDTWFFDGDPEQPQPTERKLKVAVGEDDEELYVEKTGMWAAVPSHMLPPGWEYGPEADARAGRPVEDPDVATRIQTATLLRAVADEIEAEHLDVVSSELMARPDWAPRPGETPLDALTFAGGRHLVDLAVNMKVRDGAVVEIPVFAGGGS